MKLKFAALLAAILTTVALGASKDCPTPVVSIKGPCPKEVVCTNLKDVKVSCPDTGTDCPPCVCRCEDGAGSHATAKASATATAHPGASGGHATAGHWSVPVSLGVIPSQTFTVAWDETLVRGKWDPEIRLSQDHSWMAGAGLAYQWRSRWQLAGQLLYIDRPDADSEWTLKSHARTHPSILASDTRTSTSADNWGFLVTVNIPIGK